MMKAKPLQTPKNTLTLLLWLRAAALGLLLLASSGVNFWFEDLAAQFINWPRLSWVIVLSTLMTVVSLLLRQKLAEKLHVFTVLLFDALLWCVAVSATGGAVNPAISFVLVLLCVAALALPLYLSVVLFVLMAAAYAALLQFSPHYHHAMMMSWHLWGMWVLFVFNAVIMLWLIVHLLRVIRGKDIAIAEFREQTVRDEQLIAMGTLAGSVTHEIGTPLSTIALLVEDKDDEDSLLISQQIVRCKKALLKLRHVHEMEDYIEDGGVFFQQLQQELLLIKPAAVVSWQVNIAQAMQCSAILQHALLALLSNAVDAAKDWVRVSIFAEAGQICIHILHNGEPLDDAILENLGRRIIQSNKRDGLGVGYYLANASIEQLQGRVEIRNSSDGVLTCIYLPSLSAHD
jgi:two-component system sensor histidine kinase RegB